MVKNVKQTVAFLEKLRHFIFIDPSNRHDLLLLQTLWFSNNILLYYRWTRVIITTVTGRPLSLRKKSCIREFAEMIDARESSAKKHVHFNDMT